MLGVCVHVCVTAQDAITAKSFFTSYPPGPFNPPAGGIVKGDVTSALKASAHVISGSVTVQGQKHFYMELQNVVAELVDDGSLSMYASTQSPGICQYAATSITGLPANKINVAARRAGGGFGGKLTRQVCARQHGFV